SSRRERFQLRLESITLGFKGRKSHEEKVCQAGRLRRDFCRESTVTRERKDFSRATTDEKRSAPYKCAACCRSAACANQDLRALRQQPSQACSVRRLGMGVFR